MLSVGEFKYILVVNYTVFWSWKHNKSAKQIHTGNYAPNPWALNRVTQVLTHQVGSFFTWFSYILNLRFADLLCFQDQKTVYITKVHI